MKYKTGLLLVTALALSACGGGDSSSSGSYSEQQKNFYEVSFNHLPECAIDDSTKIIRIPSFSPTGRLARECKVKLPQLNGGLTFSLNCFANRVHIKGEKRHIDALKKSIESGKPYAVVCPN